MPRVCLSLALLLTIACSTTSLAQPPLAVLSLPEGFRIREFAAVEDARQLARSDAGVIYVGSRSAGTVTALKDTDGDGDADKRWVVATDLALPSGIAWFKGDLYVGAVSTIYRFADIDQHLDAPPKPTVVTDSLPSDQHHGWKYLKFGPDQMLYVPIGAPCNVCLPRDPRYTSVLRMNPADGLATIYATGIRNTVGFAWHPVTKVLWFTDNGRDLLGDESPPDELNVAIRAGQHFGYPFVHGKSVVDPQFGKKLPKDLSPLAPALELQAHSASIGMTFYDGKMFPARYRNALFIAQHGSWNRTEKAGPVGYQVMAVWTDGYRVTGQEPFITGFLYKGTPWGRPVDLLVQPDGSLLLSDDGAGAIYRVSYVEPFKEPPPNTDEDDDLDDDE